MNESKLSRKRVKRKGIKSVDGSEAKNTTPVRRRKETSQNIIRQDSPPCSYLSSQVVSESEVHWDYDTPQIRKYRSRMGVGVRREDDSPLTPLLLTDQLSIGKPSPIYKSSPRVCAREIATNAEADAAYNDLVEFCSKLTNRRRLVNEAVSLQETPQAHKPSEIDDLIDRQRDCQYLNYSGNPTGATVIATSAEDGCRDTDSVSAYSDTLLFSDDDSLLLQATQPTTTDTVSVGPKAKNDEVNFESDDSFDIIMSQMDESEILGGQTSKVEDADAQDCWTWAPDPGGSSRSTKRFKSNDDRGRRVAGGTPLRRIQSSPTIPSRSSGKLCSQLEIEHKRLEAKRRRELRLGRL